MSAVILPRGLRQLMCVMGCVCFACRVLTIICCLFLNLLGLAILMKLNTEIISEHRSHIIWASLWQNPQSDMCAQRRLRSAWASANNGNDKSKQKHCLKWAVINSRRHYLVLRGHFMMACLHGASGSGLILNEGSNLIDFITLLENILVSSGFWG